jgi:hypothetical protein
LGFAIQFVRGILVAKFLGPELFGIWGFLMLVQQYLSYTGLGMQYAITAELATKDSITSDERSDIIGSSLVITGLISFVLLLLGLGIQVTGFPLFEKYYFSHYALALFLVVGLYHLQQLFTNIYRVFGYLSRIVASELLTAIIPLVSVLMFNNSPILINILLWALVFLVFKCSYLHNKETI